MKVLFSCRPGIGHYHPLVGLASALVGEGHQVQFAARADLVDLIRGDGFEAEPAGLSREQHLERLAVEIPELASAPPERMRELLFPRSFAGFEVPPRVEDLRAIARAWHPDLIVHEMAEFAAPLAAALEDVPAVNHSWGPLVASDVMAAASEQVSRHWRSAGLAAPERGAMYDGLYLDVCPPSLQEAHLATIPRVQRIRSVPVSSGRTDDAPWLDALGDRPVVLVTFGTVFNRQPDLVDAIVHGLAGRDCDTVVALGPQFDTSALGVLPRNCQLHEWVPWERTLARTDLVITHGGASSTLGPLASGIPIVMVPLAADHFVNAESVRRSGAAVILDRSKLTASTIDDSVNSALSDTFRAAAKRVADEIAEAPTPSEVVPVLEGFVRETSSHR